MRLRSITITAALCLALSASWRIGVAIADDLNEEITAEITEAADATFDWFDDAGGLENERIWDHFWNFTALIRARNTAALVKWVEFYRERGLHDEGIASVLLAAFKYEDYTCRENEIWFIPTSVWLILTCER